MNEKRIIKLEELITSIINKYSNPSLSCIRKNVTNHTKGVSLTDIQATIDILRKKRNIIMQRKDNDIRPLNWTYRMPRKYEYATGIFGDCGKCGNIVEWQYGGDGNDVPKYQEISGSCGSGARSDYHSMRCPECGRSKVWDLAGD
jgi:hypothetical protein